MRQLINFLKYNNLTVVILAVILLLGAGAFAQTDAGQAAIGEKITRIEGVDNTLLLAANPDEMNFDFTIEKIEQDEKLYYVTYTILDLVKLDSAWQYQLTEKTRKVTKKLRRDLGEYLAEEFRQEHYARVKKLKEEQARALPSGPEARVQVTEYSGLIGKTLDAVAIVFPGYEPVKVRKLESPVIAPEALARISGEEAGATSTPDNLTKIYNDYITSHPDLFAEPTATTTATTTEFLPPPPPAGTPPQAGGENGEQGGEGETGTDTDSGATTTAAETATSTDSGGANATSTPAAEPEVEIIEIDNM